jgi:hypothetical protein
MQPHGGRLGLVKKYAATASRTFARKTNLMAAGKILTGANGRNGEN